MSARISVWSDVECAGGTRTGAVPPVVAASQKMVLDQRHQLTVQVPRDHDWLDGLQAMDVLRVDTDSGETYEWRIATMEDGRGDGAPVTTVVADPIAVDLRDAILIGDEQSGGVTYYNLGGVNGTAAHYIDSFVLPALTDAGISWISRGTIDSSERMDLTWDGITPMELIDRMARRLSLEWQLRRNGSTDYQIDLLTEIGSSLSSVLVAERRNLLSVTRRRDRENLYTVLLPFGEKPPESEERATIAQATWKVTSIAADTPSSGTDRVTLADPAGNDGPIAIDDQFVGNYLLAPDGTLQQITDSDQANDTVDVGDSSAFSVGDHVEIRKDSSATYLNEIESPTGKTAHGRIAGTFIVTGARGERNWVRNPFMRDWTTQPGAQQCLATASSGATSISLTGLPANLEIRDGDQVWYWQEGSATTTDDVARVTADTTADGSGNATISVSQGPASVLSSTAIYLFTITGDAPDGWDETAGAATDSTNVFLRHDTSVDTSTSCQIREVSNLAAAEPIKLKGLAANEKVQAGDTIEWNSKYYTATVPATADGNGDVDVPVQPKDSSTAVNDAVTITRPAFANGLSFGQAITLYSNVHPGGTILKTPEITIPHVAALPTIWLRAQFTLRASRDIQYDLTSTGSLSPPKLQLYDGADQLLQEVQYDDVTIGGASNVGEEVHFILGVAHEMTADLTCYGRVVGVPNTSSGSSGFDFDGDPFTYLRWISLTLGPDKRVPPVEGSHATKIFQEGQRELVDRDSWPTTFRISLRELRELWDASPAEQNVMLGGTIRIKVPSMGIDENVRVVELVRDLVNPENTQVTLDTRLNRLTATTARQKPKPVFADVKVETDAAGEDELTISTTDDPPTKTGTRRIEDLSEDSTTGELTKKDYDAGDTNEKYQSV